jgi:hypothetical protein
VVLKPFKVEHLEHAIRQALDLPAVTASAQLAESERAPKAPRAPAPTNGKRSTGEPH